MRSSVANAVRREVFERDGLQCTYVADDGHRCESRAFLELDHVTPKAHGGTGEAENLRVRCRAHNQLWAEQAFGREAVERNKHFRQQQRARGRREVREVSQLGHPFDREREVETKRASLPIFGKVRLALRNMGFREVEARRAIAEVQRKHDGSESPTLEQAVREALLVLTATAA